MNRNKLSAAPRQLVTTKSLTVSMAVLWVVTILAMSMFIQSVDTLGTALQWVTFGYIGLWLASLIGVPTLRYRRRNRQVNRVIAQKYALEESAA